MMTVFLSNIVVARNGPRALKQIPVQLETPFNCAKSIVIIGAQGNYISPGLENDKWERYSGRNIPPSFILPKLLINISTRLSIGARILSRSRNFTIDRALN